MWKLKKWDINYKISNKIKCKQTTGIILITVIKLKLVFFSVDVSVYEQFV